MSKLNTFSEFSSIAEPDDEECVKKQEYTSPNEQFTVEELIASLKKMVKKDPLLASSLVYISESRMNVCAAGSIIVDGKFGLIIQY